eukprot:CAMPEP_0184023576 /NCGR_PEP_ID=MMETSP0954-20121128/11461_1 /TAXON_ID=627963 /ORGANISM="Aplanochytrium sp, Strain PBS07" /LENGTH=456 /DNA_ID=CAMNT_0026306523 /DNA_START=22 /DNA_END=1389 /DNA_ORIENTATION=+
MDEEIVLACCSSGQRDVKNASSDKHGSLTAFRLSAKAEVIASFADSVGIKNGLSIVANPNGLYGSAGDTLTCVQGKKSNIHFYNWSKETTSLRCATPEKILTTTVSREGSFFFAGGESGKIYCWETSSGDLVKVWKAHYRSVTALTLLDDDSFVLSGGKDALVNCWSFSEVVDEDALDVQPFMTWSEHRLPISSIRTGTGGVNSRVLTCSLDNTAKIWSVPLKSLLYSIYFPCPLNDCVLDPAERWVYAGGEDGNVYMKALSWDAHSDEIDRRKRQRTNSSRLLNKTNEKKEMSATTVLGVHEASVTCLSLSLDGSLLVSGSLDSTCQIWDIQSRQSIKSINFASPVVSLLISTAPSKSLRNRGYESKLGLAKMHALYKYKSVPKENVEKEDADGSGWINFRLGARKSDVELWKRKDSDFPLLLDSTCQGGSPDSSIETERLRATIAKLEEENSRW